MKFSTCAPLGAVAICAFALSLNAMADESPFGFSVQGRLILDGVTIHEPGGLDFEFTLWDAEIDGAQIGGTCTVAGLAVRSGLFQTLIDFGAVTDGAPRWVEIRLDLDPGPGVDFVTLDPRRPLGRASQADFAFSGGEWTNTNGDLSYVGGYIGIGLSAPMEMLHLYGSDPGIRIEDVEDPDAFTTITDDGQTLYLRKIVPDAVLPQDDGAFIQIDPMPSAFDGTARVQLFRNTATGGIKTVDVYDGDGSAFRCASIGANGLDTWFATFQAGNPEGRVGIGTSGPQTKLHVMPVNYPIALRLQHASSDTIMDFETVSGPNWRFTAGVDTTFRFGKDANNDYLVFESGAQSIGVFKSDPDPLYALDVNGDVRATSFIPPSDARLKDYIRPLNFGLDSLLALRPVSYRWADGTQLAKTHGDRTELGFIAQEVREIIPFIVHEDGDGMLGLAYARLIPVVVAAMQEQQAIIDDLKNQLTARDERMAKLLDRVERLERAGNEGQSK